MGLHLSLFPHPLASVIGPAERQLRLAAANALIEETQPLHLTNVK